MWLFKIRKSIIGLFKPWKIIVIFILCAYYRLELSPLSFTIVDKIKIQNNYIYVLEIENLISDYTYYIATSKKENFLPRYFKYDWLNQLNSYLDNSNYLFFISDVIFYKKDFDITVIDTKLILSLKNDLKFTQNIDYFDDVFLKTLEKKCYLLKINQVTCDLN